MLAQGVGRYWRLKRLSLEHVPGRAARGVRPVGLPHPLDAPPYFIQRSLTCSQVGWRLVRRVLCASVLTLGSFLCFFLHHRMRVPWIADFINPSAGLVKWHVFSSPKCCMCGNPPWKCVDLEFMCMQVEVERVLGQVAGRAACAWPAGQGGQAGRPGHFAHFAPFCFVLHSYHLHSNISTKLVEIVSSKA